MAGGAASRFGGAAKGLERVGGIRIIDRVAAALRESTDELWLIANSKEAERWLPDARVGADIVIGAGGLGGLHAALHHARRPVLVVAWDMPFVPAALLRRLRSLSDGADAVLPESPSRRGLEPLCAWYGLPCLGAIQESLDSGDHRMIGFLERLRVARLPGSSVAEFGDPGILFMNVNTPEDLTLAETYAATTGHHCRTEEQRQDDSRRQAGS